MGRLLGLDFGTVRIGAAISDALGLTAQPLPFFPAHGRKACLEAIATFCRERGVERIVLGLPRHLDGNEGASSKLVRKFGADLGARVGLPIEYLDERLTTVAAERLLIEADVSRQKRREVIDSMAAAMLLQNYLDRQEAAGEP